LRVDRGADDPRLYTVSVPSEAFDSRRARFQDAPEMCLQRLQRELDENAELPSGSSLVITTATSTLPRVPAAPLPDPQAHASAERTER
jgi:hypothetical protein